MEKQRWEESEKRREEKKERRSEKRKSQQKDLRVRVKVEKPRFTVFFPASLCRVLVYPHLVHPPSPGHRGTLRGRRDNHRFEWATST